ncbi:MAG: hypothetical protein HXX17_08225 [Geobacteraceae bacterium]|nr:hypothetical protein [Geobacteraceae bacterium]
MTDQYTGPDRRTISSDVHWTFKKELQLGHIISTVIFALTGLFYVTKMDQRIAIIETQVTAQKEKDSAQDKVYSEALQQIHAQMDRIDAKLDRLVERNGK